MPCCAAINCSNKPENTTGKTFHKFPLSRPNLLKQWLVLLRRRDFKPVKASCVCSDHFIEECFDRTGQVTRLRDYAVPTLFNFSTPLRKRQQAHMMDQNKTSRGPGRPAKKRGSDQPSEARQKRPKKCMMEDADEVYSDVDDDHIIGDDETNQVEDDHGSSGDDERDEVEDDYYTEDDERDEVEDDYGTGDHEQDEVEDYHGTGDDEQDEVEDDHGTGDDEQDEVEDDLGTEDDEVKDDHGTGDDEQDEVENDHGTEDDEVEDDHGTGDDEQDEVEDVYGNSAVTGNCFVCNKSLSVENSFDLHILTDTTNTQMGKKLKEIVWATSVEILPEDMLCLTCAHLLNYVDKMEAELAVLKKSILDSVKYNLEGKGFEVTSY